MTDEAKQEQTGVNDSGTKAGADARLTRECSTPVRFRLLDKDDRPVGTFDTALEAASAAGGFWPGMGQRDDDREGWDIETIRPELPAFSRASHSS